MLESPVAFAPQAPARETGVPVVPGELDHEPLDNGVPVVPGELDHEPLDNGVPVVPGELDHEP